MNAASLRPFEDDVTLMLHVESRDNPFRRRSLTRMDWPSILSALLTVLLPLQFLVIAAHDMLDVPGWTHGSQVRAALGRRKFWLATVINAIFPGFAAVTAIVFPRASAPTWIVNYWAWYCGATLFFAITMWWVPYFFGASAETKALYQRMYAGTRQVLPLRGENPSPNLLHLVLHGLFAGNFALALAVRFASR